MFQRLYIDGKLKRSSKGEPMKVRQWMDNMELAWSKDGMCPLTVAGQSDFNKAHSVTRVSVDELVIVTTANKTLRCVNVER